MNQLATLRAARELEAESLKLIAQGEAEVAQFFNSISDLIERAKRGDLRDPVEWRDIPGARFFSEGTLRKFRNLEAAYAKFQIEATGGDNPLEKNQ